MTNRFEQSTPPSIHDVYRGLPIGPGGVEPFIFRDRGRHGRGPARLPWRRLVVACRQGLRWIIGLWTWTRSADARGRYGDPAGGRPTSGACP